MIEREDNKQIDDLLDSLLAGYSAVEPRPGLEIRIRAGLKARAAKQQKRWALAFAVSGAVVVMAVLLAKVQSPGSRDVVIQKPAPVTAPVSVSTGPSPTQAGARGVAYGRRAKLRVHSNTPILLQIANAIPAEDNLVFEHQKLYLSVPAQQEQQPAEEQKPSAPNISIQHLDVRPIEVRDINSAKDIGSER